MKSSRVPDGIRRCSRRALVVSRFSQIRTCVEPEVSNIVREVLRILREVSHILREASRIKRAVSSIRKAVSHIMRAVSRIMREVLRIMREVSHMSTCDACPHLVWIAVCRDPRTHRKYTHTHVVSLKRRLTALRTNQGAQEVNSGAHPIKC
jgi:phosphate uptake regulator